jgi:hypothetical protein
MRVDWLFGRNNMRAPWIVAILVLTNALLLRALDPSELVAARLPRQLPAPAARLQPVTPVASSISTKRLAEYGYAGRAPLARLVDKLTEKGAAVIASTWCSPSPPLVDQPHGARLVAYTDPETVGSLRRDPDNDQVLADAMAHSASSWASPSTWRHSSRRSATMARPRRRRSQPVPADAGRYGEVDPLLEAAAKGNGSVNTDLESLVIRRIPMLFSWPAGRRAGVVDRGAAGRPGRQHLSDRHPRAVSCRSAP